MMEKLMNLTTRLAASAMSFAHLGSVGRGKSAAADDDKDYKDDDKKDDDKKDAKKDASAKKADDQDDTGDDDASARADDPSAEDDDDKDDKKGKAKKASAEDDDDKDDKKGKASATAHGPGDEDEDDAEELHGKSIVASARLREQARCAAIMNCRAAGRNVPLAARLALTTRMTRDEAIGILEDTPAAPEPASQSRASRNPRLGSGGDVAVDSKAALSASWDRAFEKAGAVRRK
jgi:hypothetical protein